MREKDLLLLSNSMENMVMLPLAVPVFQKNTVTVCSTLLWCLVAFTAALIFSSALSLPKLVS